jgi:hypothetical protein
MNILTNIFRRLNPTQPNRVMRTTAFYRTKDGLRDFHFSFEQQADGSWRAFIVGDIQYGGRPDDCHSTHRLTDGGRHYVCWTRPLRTEQEARDVAALWGDKTQRYIRFGENF